MQGAASGSGTSLAELMAARKEDRNSLGAHREQMQAHVQGLRCLQSSRPSTATPKTTRAVEPQGDGAGDNIPLRLVMDAMSCELSVPRATLMLRLRQHH